MVHIQMCVCVSLLLKFSQCFQKKDIFSRQILEIGNFKILFLYGIKQEFSLNCSHKNLSPNFDPYIFAFIVVFFDLLRLQIFAG